MSIKDWLISSTHTLQENSVESALLDAQLLLVDLLKKDRSWVLAHPEHELSSSKVVVLNKKLERRCSHEPLAYIRGKQEFYGRDFIVSADTLTPRPETEAIIEFALEILKKKDVKTIADIGTGSGCIVISLNLESTDQKRYTGYEISPAAMKIAIKNAQVLNADVEFVETDITKNVANDWQNADLLVANLPYVPEDFHINLAATHEPAFAIFGGVDGLDYYRSLFAKVSHTTKYVITESLPPQHDELKNIAMKAGFALTKSQDFVQLFTRES